MSQDHDRESTTAGAPRPGAADLITLRGVTRVFYGGVRALGGIDLCVGEGEFLTIIGASGTGKTTLLRIMAGLDEPTAGQVRRDPAIARTGGTAMVFQDPALMPWASAFDNVWLPLRIAGASRADAHAQVMAALETVDLAARRDALPAELSGGMRMRVSIARALVTSPRLLLLDEPFAALDELTRFRLNDVLRGLWQRKRLTAVLVTHSVYEAAYLSTRVAVISARHGHISAEMAISGDIERNQAFRESTAYFDYVRRLSTLLGQAG